LPRQGGAPPPPGGRGGGRLAVFIGGWGGGAGVGTGGAVAGAGHGGKGGLAVMFGSERSGLTSGMPVTVGLLYLDTRSLLPRH